MNATSLSSEIAESQEARCSLAQVRNRVNLEMLRFLSRINEPDLRKQICEIMQSRNDLSAGMLTFLSGKSLGATTKEIAKLAASVQLSYLANSEHSNIARSFNRSVLPTPKYAGSMLILGDMLAALAFAELLPFGKHVVKTISKAGFSCCDAACAEASNKKPPMLKKDYMIIAGKYASFFRAASLCGALAVSASHSERKALADYGKFFGIAFRMKNDFEGRIQPFQTNSTGKDLSEKWKEVVATYSDRAKKSISFFSQTTYTSLLLEMAESLKN